MRNTLKNTISIAGVILVTLAGASFAQSSSTNKFLNALKPAPGKTTSATRSFGTPPANNNAVSSQDRSFIQSLNPTRAIRVEERDKLIAIVDKSELPSVNAKILFGYDSARIDQRSYAELDQIAEALLDSALADAKIMLNGHTDAAGSRYYNQDLSERRALSVKHYLTQTYDISASRLVVAGFGEDRLHDPHQPNSGKNRRVEIINLGK